MSNPFLDQQNPPPIPSILADAAQKERARIRAKLEANVPFTVEERAAMAGMLDRHAGVVGVLVRRVADWAVRAIGEQEKNDDGVHEMTATLAFHQFDDDGCPYLNFRIDEKRSSVDVEGRYDKGRWMNV